MASEMKLGMSPAKLIVLSLLAVSCFLTEPVYSQGTTNATSNDTTTPSATGGTTQDSANATTTQVQTTTTTLPPTTTIAPNQPKTEIGETVIGQCLCDLTGNECDINCCCDNECTAEDIDTFVCNPVSIVVDGKKCFSEEVFPFTNSPATTRKENGLFCIYYDNYKERNFYLDPDFILDMPSFSEYVNRYSESSNQQPEMYDEPVYTLSSSYKQGDPLYIVYPNLSRGYLTLPTSAATSLCNANNPISFLQESESECARDIPTLAAATCTSTAGFDAASYYSNFRVVLTPALFGYVVNGSFVDIPTPAPPTVQPPTVGTTANTTATTPPATTTIPIITTTPTPTTVDPDLVQSLFNNPYTIAVDTTSMTHLCELSPGNRTNCSFTDPPQPTFNAGTCQNVVMEARYFLTMNGTAGISSVAVQFVFHNIQQADLPSTQKFTVKYRSVSDGNETVARSGNPGYQIGKPLLYGTLIPADLTQNQHIEIATDPALGLTLVQATATGDCAQASGRVPVKFGQNMRTGCVIRLSTTSFDPTTCANFQDTIIQTLEGSANVPQFDFLRNEWIENNRFVATFGNVPANRVGDWVRVINSNTTNRRPIPVASFPQFQALPPNTCRLRMGLHIQVLYANVGALASPQAKIIGVALLYDDEREVTYRCTGAFCQDATTAQEQVFEVSNSISFVDVSQPAVKQQGEAPIFIARVPNDFFYPFLYYTSSSGLPGPSVLLVLLTSVVVSCLSFRPHLL